MKHLQTILTTCLAICAQPTFAYEPIVFDENSRCDRMKRWPTIFIADVRFDKFVETQIDPNNVFRQYHLNNVMCLQGCDIDTFKTTGFKIVSEETIANDDGWGHHDPIRHEEVNSKQNVFFFRYPEKGIEKPEPFFIRTAMEIGISMKPEHNQLGLIFPATPTFLRRLSYCGFPTP